MNEIPPAPLTQAQSPIGPNPSEELLKRLCRDVAKSSTWMKLLGVVSIIQGVILVFTIIGILAAWLPIWIGFILYRAAGDADSASHGAPQRLEAFVARINRYFLIQGVLMLLSILVAIIAMMVLGMAFFTRMTGVF